MLILHFCYMDMVGGFLTFPLKFPGTAVWRAMKVGGNLFPALLQIRQQR
jgi:hypothetical protein